jgi:hypothetical protein
MTMRALRLFPALCLSLTCSTSLLAQNLQPESRQEFRRVFGTSPSLPLPQTVQRQRIELFSKSLRDPSFRSLLDQKSTPESINSTALLEILLNGQKPRKYVLFWHLVSLDLTAIDHRATPSTSPTSFHQQFGPARAARALALIHQAIFETQNAFDRKYETTLQGPSITPDAGASVETAMTEATYQVMAWLYPGLNDQGLRDPRSGNEAQLPPDSPCEVSAPFSLSRYYRCALQKADEEQMARLGIAFANATDQQKLEQQIRRKAGIKVGRAIAGRIIAERSQDGAERPDPVWDKDFVPRRVRLNTKDDNYAYLQWVRDPVSGFETALGGYWATVKPFALTSGFQFRPDIDPRTTFFRDPANPATLKSYDIVRKWGRDARLNDVSKDNEADRPPALGLYIAQYWAYDGTANLCAPARLYNQIALATLAHLENAKDDGYGFDLESPVDLARFFALINIALADSAVAAWDAKYHFQFPRPVTYIRAVEQAGAGAAMTSAMTNPAEAKPAAATAAPAAKADTAKPATAAAKPIPAAGAAGAAGATGNAVPPRWLPVGAQNTNSEQVFNITPPFPSYPSGHAVFGGALFGILRQFIKPDVKFSFRSDEFNGLNRDAFNYVRCSNYLDANGERLPENPQREKNPNDHTPEEFCNPRPLTLNCAERENADSRLFMGVHWVFDADDGIVMGNKVAREVYGTQMKPTAMTMAKYGQPAAKPFSVSKGSSGSELKRDDLVCDDLKSKLPTGLDDTARFGPLAVKEIVLK